MTRLTLSMALAATVLLAPALTGAATGLQYERAVLLTQDPLVMRLSKDEFRIAFGVKSEQCANGCSGIIRYRVQWQTDDGAEREETKRVSYVISPSSSRAVTVDRQYFDTAEGAHTTQILKISVDLITCVQSTDVASGGPFADYRPERLAVGEWH